MNIESLNQLINGSDIRGIAVDTDGYEANLSVKEVRKLASGFLQLLKRDKKIDRRPLRIAIGFDSRISGPAIKEALVEVFLEAGVVVLDADLATTPAMVMATQFPEIDADAGIMITASHLPYFYNGLKFFTKDGGEHEDMEKLCNMDIKIEGQEKGYVESISLISHYAKDLVKKIQKGSGLERPLEGLHIVLMLGMEQEAFLRAKFLSV